MKGRLPKPTNTKKLEGNPGKRPLNDVPEPEAPKRFPKPPPKIGKHARQFWNQYGFALYNLGLLTEVDLPAWRLLCEGYERYERAKLKLGERFLELTQTGSKRHPLLLIIEKEREAMERAMARFGMTPVDRERIRSENGSADDEFGDLMGTN